jgi:hypothetical protein
MSSSLYSATGCRLEDHRPSRDVLIPQAARGLPEMRPRRDSSFGNGGFALRVEARATWVLGAFLGRPAALLRIATGVGDNGGS